MMSYCKFCNSLIQTACASRGRWEGWNRRGGEEMLELNRIYNEGCIEGMKKIERNSINSMGMGDRV